MRAGPTPVVSGLELAGPGRPPAPALLRHLPRRRVLLLASVLLLVSALVRFGAGARGVDAVDLPIATSSPQTDAAIERALARIAGGAESSRTYLDLGGTYLQKARESGDPAHYDRAEQALRRALDLDGSSAEAATLLGTLALARHRFDQALEWGQRARALAPSSAAPLGVVGDALVELGRYEEAFAAFDAMAARRPDLRSYSRVAHARELIGDRAGAIDLMERAAAAGPPAGENTAWTLVQLGNLHFAGGALDAAEVAYRRALAGYPGHPPAVAGVARVRAARGDLGGAAAIYERLVAAVPLPEYAVALAELYQAMERPADAERQRALVRAVDGLFRAAGVDTDLEMVLYAADRRDDPAGTIGRARAAFAARPGLHGDEALAWALFRAGDCAAALPHARASLRLGTQDPTLLYRAGAVAACAGERAEAAARLEAALALNPAFSPLHAPEARRLLAQLRAEVPR